MDESTYNLVNAILTGVSALGTVGAVIVALWLARRDERLRLRINVSTGGYVETTRTGVGASGFGILVSIANLGRRPVQVVSVGWRIGFWRRQYLHVVFRPDPNTRRPPTSLTDGQVVIYMLPIEAFDKEIPGHIKALPFLERRLAHRSLRLVVNTAVGRAFLVRPDQLLGSHIRKLLRGELPPPEA